MYTARHVVSCFLTRGKYVLVLRRSTQVNTYQGIWSGVSGSVDDDPLVQSLREIQEETGLGPDHVRLLKRGAPLEIVDDDRQIRWLVHPFLFKIREPFSIRLSWEHTEYRWIDPRSLRELTCVPMLQEALMRVWDPATLGPPPRSHEQAAANALSLSPEQSANGVPSSRNGVSQGRDSGPRTGPIHGVRRQNGEHSATLALRTSGTHPPLVLDEDGRDGEALPVEDAPEDESLLDRDMSFVRPPWEPRSSGQGAAVQLKVRLATVTGEFPNPHLMATPTGEEIRPPRPTGPALLEDGLLEPVLEALRDAPCVEPLRLLHRGLEALEVAGDRSGASSPGTWLDDLKRVSLRVISLRPSLPFLAFACAQVLYEVQMAVSRGEDLPGLQRTLSNSLQRFQKEETGALNDVIDEVSRLIPPGGVVCTVGYSPILLEALRRNQHFGVRLIVPEGRPRYDGRRLAREVLELGKSVTLITDGAFGLHLAEADLVVLEGYGLLLDGSAICRVGTFPMSLAARHFHVPLYIAATCQRLDLRLEAPSLLVLEERRSDEVWEHHGPGLDVRNVAFDRIPGDHITGILTEEGLIEPQAMTGEVKSRDHLRAAL